MAIGSAPEIGYQFTLWARMSPEAREAWFKYMRDSWGSNLYAGEATICYPDEQLRQQYLHEILEDCNVEQNVRIPTVD